MCHQSFTGELFNDMSKARYETHKDLNAMQSEVNFWKVRNALSQMGSMYLEINQVENALEFFQKKYNLERKNMTRDGQMIHFRWFDTEEYAATCNGLGGCYIKMGRLDDAMKTFQEGVNCTDPNDPQSQHAFLLNNLAEAHVKRFEFKEAIALRRRMLSIHKKNHGENSYHYVVGLFSLGCVLLNDGKYSEGHT